MLRLVELRVSCADVAFTLPGRWVFCLLQGERAHENDQSARSAAAALRVRFALVIGREDVDESFGPASVVLRGYGGRVGAGTWSGLLSGLTPRWVVLRPARRLGPGRSGTCRRCRPGLPGLGKRPGFHRPAASGCVPSLNHRKGTAMAIVAISSGMVALRENAGLCGSGRAGVAAAAGPGLLPRCGWDSGGGLPVTPALLGMRTRIVAWRWGRDLRVACCCLEHAGQYSGPGACRP
jgi:hypothetical protein